MSDLRSRLTSILIALYAAGCGLIAGGAPPGPPAAEIPRVASIPVGKAPILVAVSPDGGRVYAASNDGKLVVIDTATNTAIKTFDVSPYSVALAVTPDGGRVLISNLFGGSLTVLDTATLTLAPAVQLVADLRRGGYGRIAISPDGATAYVVNQPNAQLVTVDLASGTTNSQMLDIRPTDVTLTPDGKRAIVCGCRPVCAPGTCKMYDTAAASFGAYVSVAAQPFRTAIDPSGARAYITSIGEPGLSVVDLASQQSIATVRGPIQPTGVAVSPDGARVYVASQTSGTVTVIDTSSNAILSVGHLASYVREVALSPDGKRAYVSTDSDVAVVETSSFAAP